MLAYGMSSPNSLMPWLPIASHTIHTSGLQPQYHIAFAFLGPAQTLNSLVCSPSPLHLLPPFLTTSSTYRRIGCGHCIPSFPRQWRQQQMQSISVWHMGSAMGPYECSFTRLCYCSLVARK